MGVTAVSFCAQAARADEIKVMMCAMTRTATDEIGDCPGDVGVIGSNELTTRRTWEPRARSTSSSTLAGTMCKGDHASPFRSPVREGEAPRGLKAQV